MPPKASSKSLADQLDTDNQLMASRLAQLKQSLKKQKEERSSRGKGVIWRSGAPAGTLNNHAIKVLESNPHRRRPGLPGSGKHKPAPPAGGRSGSGARRPSPPAAMPALEADQQDLLAKFREAAPPPVPSVNNPEDMVELTGAESDNAPVSEHDGSDSFDEDAGHQGFLDALNSWRTGVPAGSPSKQQGGTDGGAVVSSSNPHPVDGCPNTSNSFHACTDHCKAVAKGGLAATPSAPTTGAASKENTITARQWQPAEATSLLDGPGYDEAASAAAFRAAVQSWRTGEPEPPVGAAAPPRKAPKVWIPPADPTEVASFECQTDAAPPRPTTANTTIEFQTTTTLTYMEKLMLARKRKNPSVLGRVDRGKSASTAAEASAGKHAASTPAATPGVSDPDNWLAPMQTGSIDELADTATMHALEVTEVTDDEEDGAFRATPCVVEEPADSSDGSDSQLLERPMTSRKIQITPEYGNDSEGADDEAEYDVSEVLEADGIDGSAAVVDNPTTPTRPSNSLIAPNDVDCTPRAAAVAPRITTTHVTDSSDDSDVELAAADFASSMSAASTAAALAGMSALALDDEESEDAAEDNDGNGSHGSPHRDIITPGMMHDFEEMERQTL